MNITFFETKEFKQIAHLVEEVQNLHANLFPSVYKPFEYSEIEKAMQVILSDEACKVWVAQYNGEVIGYVLLMIKVVPENGFHFGFNIMHIDQISVSKKIQHTGVGTALMNKVEALAKELKIDRVELDHLNLNGVASDFFKSKGFISYRTKCYKILE